MQSESSESIRIYDTELATPILTQWSEDEMRIPGVDFATGWDRYSEMRLAVLCAPTLHDALTMTSAELYERGHDHWVIHHGGHGHCDCPAPVCNLNLAQRPFDIADVLVSHNGLSFDNNVLRANGPHVADSYCYDTLAEWRHVTRKRVKLDDLARANGIEGKTGNGADAPMKWARGLHKEVILYCFEDCRIVALLYQRIQERNGLIDSYRGTFVALPKAATQNRQEGLF